MPAQLLFRHRRRAAAAALMLPLLILGACAERAQWVNDEVPPETWGQDRAACRERADALAARQLDQDLSSNQITGDTGTLSQQFAVEDAKELRRKLYSQCMGARGYELKGD